MSPMTMIHDVCIKKSFNLTDDIRWDDLGMGPYMIQKWVSMTSSDNAYILNLTLNKLALKSVLDDRMAYQLASALTKPYKRKFRYLKGTKTAKEETGKYTFDEDITSGSVKEYTRLLEILNNEE